MQFYTIFQDIKNYMNKTSKRNSVTTKISTLLILSGIISQVFAMTIESDHSYPKYLEVFCPTATDNKISCWDQSRDIKIAKIDEMDADVSFNLNKVNTSQCTNGKRLCIIANNGSAKYTTTNPLDNSPQCILRFDYIKSKGDGEISVSNECGRLESYNKDSTLKDVLGSNHEPVGATFANLDSASNVFLFYKGEANGVPTKAESLNIELYRDSFGLNANFGNIFTFGMRAKHDSYGFGYANNIQNVKECYIEAKAELITFSGNLKEYTVYAKATPECNYTGLCSNGIKYNASNSACLPSCYKSAQENDCVPPG